MKKNWIIGVCCSDSDGVHLYNAVDVTSDEVKGILLSLVNEDKANDLETYDYGTTKIEEITQDRFGYLYAYSVFADYHIDYSAKAIDEMEKI